MKARLFIAMVAFASAALVSCKENYVVDVQAHRGGMGLYPEESLAAMINAIDLGVNTVEMDLCITQDKHVVLSHDKFFHHRYATRPDGTPLLPGDEKVYLYQMPYSDIITWDVGLKENPDWPEKNCQSAIKQRAFEVIQGIEDYWKENNLPPIYYNIEIKSDPSYDEGIEGVHWPEYREFTDLCMEVMESFDLGDRLVIQSFDERALNYINQKYPGHRLSYLVEGWETDFDEYMSKLDFIPEWLSPPHENVDAQLIKKAHEKGMKVVTWTVDDPAEMNRLMDLKVEAIISNYPDRLMKEAKARGAWQPNKPLEDDGWISLFDGKTMDGWRSFNSDRLIGDDWIVQDRAIYTSGQGSDATGYIVTDRIFENFDLKWEWKISKGGNSGMIYHVLEGPAFPVPYVTGPEYQIIDDENYAEMNGGYILEPWQRCAVDYAMYVPDFETRILKPAGEWNSSEIIFDNGHVTYLLNGKVTVEFDAWTKDWFERRNSGKWSYAPEYGLPRRGVICMQDHGYPAWFRNLKIKELPNKEMEEDLFNGKDLTGWINYGTELWYVDDDGYLVCESGPDKGYGYLATEKYYNDFDLSLEFKQEANGNSGVFIRSTVNGTTVSGWQVEVAPKGHDTGGIYESYGRGWLIQIPDEKENFLKEGEWNKMRILCKGDHIQTWLNGEPMSDIHDSKIGRGNGRIALQIHDGGGIKVRWRNLHVKTL